MQRVLLTGMALALLAGAFTPTSAEAQGRIYKWCLEQSRSSFGGEQTLCRFDTVAQCNASKNSLADRCVPNSYGQRP